MKAIAYKNTKVPSFSGLAVGEPPIKKFPRGIAYETIDGYFVHFYSYDKGWWNVHPGLTATEKNSGMLDDWIKDRFGATDIEPLRLTPGNIVDGVWRPGISWEFNTDRTMRRRSEQSLHLLIERLTELFLFIEPVGNGLNAYGPKTRELLILACTEAEDAWTQALRLDSSITPGPNGFSTNQYVRLADPLYLAEYQVSFVPYPDVPVIRPFHSWDVSRPTRSLEWYAAYNQTKHDRTTHLGKATLMRCIEAVLANVVLYCVRFSPFPLFNDTTPVATLVNHLLSVELVDFDITSSYVPLLDIPNNLNQYLQCFDSNRLTENWTTQPLVL